MMSKSSTLDERMENFLDKGSCECKSLVDHKKELESARENMADDIDLLASALKILGEEKRLSILYLLKEKSYCFCELEYALNLSQPTVTHHLKKLKSIDLIRLEKDGRWTIAVLDQPEILDNLDSIIGFLKNGS
jgi:ArsR family transcriptional regulator